MCPAGTPGIRGDPCAPAAGAGDGALPPHTPGCPGAGLKAGARAAPSPGDSPGCSLKGNGEKALEEA